MVQLKDPYGWYNADEEKQYRWRKPEDQSLSHLAYLALPNFTQVGYLSNTR